MKSKHSLFIYLVQHLCIPFLLLAANARTNWSCAQPPASDPNCNKAGVFLTSMPDCPTDSYQLVFSDEFDGTTLDLNKWQLQPWGYGGTGATQEYNQYANVEVSAGTCKIVAKQEEIEETLIYYEPDNAIMDDGLPNLRTFNYTSSNLWTHQKFLYGKYEIKCRIPSTRGFWPSFWTYGGLRWNEIDIFEFHTDDTDRYTCNIHHDFDGDGESPCGFVLNNAADLTQWHVYTCYFEFDRISWEIDGILVRVVPRFTTVNFSAIYCGDNIGQGAYFQQRAYPREAMHIIISMGVIAPGHGFLAPDASTVFPAIYEIDYVRYFARPSQMPGFQCQDCIDHIQYSNIQNLPPSTRVADWIGTDGNVSVNSGSRVSFLAENRITLNPGFSANTGSVLDTKLETCNGWNYEPIPVAYLGSNLIDNYKIEKCVDPMFRINATGVENYFFEAYNFSGALVASVSGIPVANHINLWNAISMTEGWYTVHLELWNCDDSDVRDFTIGVLDCSSGMIYSDGISNIGSEPEKYKDSGATAIVENSVKPIFSVYPNPTVGLINIVSLIPNSSIAQCSITDMLGRVVKHFRANDIGSYSSSMQLDIGNLAPGVYDLLIQGNDVLEQKRIVVNSENQ